jgi:hypothetical protein
MAVPLHESCEEVVAATWYRMVLCHRVKEISLLFLRWNGFVKLVYLVQYSTYYTLHAVKIND